LFKIFRGLSEVAIGTEFAMNKWMLVLAIVVPGGSLVEIR
jgi:hypothetical protein